MFPNRPRLRVGLSRNNVTSSRLSRPLSSTRPPLKPLHNRPITQPKRAPPKSSNSSTRAVPSSDDKNKVKHYFTVLYTKNSRKKHKSWLDGFIVVTDDRHVAMHNDDGKHMLSERVSKLGGLVEGNTLELRTWLIEVQNSIPEDDFISGRAFLKEILTKPVRVQQRRAFKPLLPRGKRPAPSPGGPLHDPKAPNAVILADDGVPVVLDPCLSRRMRPHQVSGVKFLFNSVRSGGGAILADDMGLGKSLQAIALVWTLLRQGRSQGPLATKAVIVCPASLVTNWVNEVKKWLGDDRLKPVAVSSGSSTFESKQALAAFINGSVRKLMIVSYEMFRSYANDLYRADIGLLVCDEGHRLKSSQGNKTIEALKKLPCGRRVILTGTPVQNDLEEFFAVCDFVNPGCLNSLQSFRSIFATPIIASRDSNASSATVRLGEARARELGKVTSKFVLRRTSNILEKYLPTKLETAIFCRLQPRQEGAYEQEAQHRYADIDTYRFSAALSAINFLRKICSHPILAKSIEQNEDDRSGEQGNKQTESVGDCREGLRNFQVNDSSKMQIAMSICEASLVVGDKVIFVSNFTTTLDLVQYALDQRKISFCRLDGSTPVNQRGDIVRRFNNGTLGDIFLLSAKAGGVGLNLIGANRLILFDPDWNPATDLQAMARVWRDGQKKRVFVYRLLSTGTIEEKIFQRQLFKGELQSALSSDSSGTAGVHSMKTEGVLAGKEGNFSAEQLRDLFQYDGKLEFCETLQVLERSQIESKLESDIDLEDDFEDPRGKTDGLLKRFSQYKERFQDENGVKDYIFCDEDDVLDKALNSDLATHGLVSYLYTQRSGSAEKGVDKRQSPVKQKKKTKKRERGYVDDTPAKDDTVHKVQQKKRKLKPMFCDEARSNDTDCESDPELAILEVMERSAARQRANRDGLKGTEMQKPPPTHKKVMKPANSEEQKPASTDDNVVDEEMESKGTPIEGVLEIENTWDEAVQALEVDDVTGFI